MNKRGFTLIELIAVITIISLVALLTFPSIVSNMKRAEDETNKNTKEVIIESAKKYVDDNLKKFAKDGTYCVKLNELVSNDYLKEDLINDDNKDSYVKIVIGEKEKYTIEDTCEEKINEENN